MHNYTSSRGKLSNALTEEDVIYGNYLFESWPSDKKRLCELNFTAIIYIRIVHCMVW